MTEQAPPDGSKEVPGVSESLLQIAASTAADMMGVYGACKRAEEGGCGPEHTCTCRPGFESEFKCRVRAAVILERAKLMRQRLTSNDPLLYERSLLGAIARAFRIADGKIRNDVT